jgi:nucleoside-diphosphate-sugar epimerase
VRILITGASGFIGKNLLLTLKQYQDDLEIVALYHQNPLRDFLDANGLGKIRAVGCDLSQKEDVHNLRSQIGERFDYCVYLAANGNPSLSVSNPLHDVTLNTVSIVSFLQCFHIDRLLYFSSGAVYNGHRGLVTPATPVITTLPYALSKHASEKYVEFFSTRGQIGAYINIRFMGAYGPYEPSRKVYFRLVNEIGVQGNTQFTIYGDGKNYIDAMYVEDMTKAVLKMLFSDKGNLTVDLGCGNPLTINELVREAAEAFGVDVSIIREGRASEYNSFYISRDGVASLFGFEPTITLREGLLKYRQFLLDAGSVHSEA